MGHVGDVHPERPLILFLVAGDGDGVVEVLRVRWVNGQRKGFGEIFAGTRNPAPEGPGGGRGLLQDSSGERAGQAVGNDDRLRLDIRPPRLTEHPEDDPLVALGGPCLAKQLDDHLVTGLGALCARIANQDRLNQQPADVLDVPRAATTKEHADKALTPALEHLDDPPGKRTATRFHLGPSWLPDDPGPNPIAGNRVAGSARRYEQIAVPVGRVRQHEAKAAGIPPKPPDHLLRVARQSHKPVGFDLDQVLPSQLLDRLFKNLPVLRVDAQIASDLADRGGPVVGVAQMLEDAMGKPKRHDVHAPGISCRGRR